MATERPPSRLLFAVLIVVVVVVAGVGAALLYEFNKGKAPVPTLTVANGDNVTVNYIGEFGSGAQAGRVFDTSLYGVALNNLTYPKSLEYTPRASHSEYTPLAVHVGASTPASGYTVGNLTFSSVVTGFWQGLVGLAGNQSHTIVVPPSLGYGPVNQSCVVSAPMVLAVPLLTLVPLAQFATLYPNGTASVGAVFTDPTYGWNDTVFGVNKTTVTLLASTSVGTKSSPGGLPFEVSALNATAVTLSSLLEPANAGLVLGHASGSGVCGSKQFIVSAVNLASGTLTENFNPEVQGQTLDFVVTVVDIFPA